MQDRAGILLYQLNEQDIFVLIGHKGEPYLAGKDIGAWSIPKGVIEPGEEPFLAALREFEEEIGKRPGATFSPLEPVVTKNGRRLLVWAGEGWCDVSSISSNPFSMEWPEGSGSFRSFPEFDRAAWVPIATAATWVKGSQKRVFGHLVDKLDAAGRVDRTAFHGTDLTTE